MVGMTLGMRGSVSSAGASLRLGIGGYLNTASAELGKTRIVAETSGTLSMLLLADELLLALRLDELEPAKDDGVVACTGILSGSWRTSAVLRSMSGSR